MTEKLSDERLAELRAVEQKRVEGRGGGAVRPAPGPTFPIGGRCTGTPHASAGKESGASGRTRRRPTSGDEHPRNSRARAGTHCGVAPHVMEGAAPLWFFRFPVGQASFGFFALLFMDA